MRFVHRIVCLFSVLMGLATFKAQAQELARKKYDIFTDTLLVINGKPIDYERIMMTREEILEADTFKINQKGLSIVSFSMRAITLGHTVELTHNKPILSQAMRNEIINKHSNFKFIYLKDINLQTKDGRLVHPSLTTIKIIFSN